ncbi:MAG: alpha/beta hydrolase [Actinomycetota bacterium]|nr:alpha/beta hydrolase [Actinomycetota bacterium]
MTDSERPVRQPALDPPIAALAVALDEHRPPDGPRTIERQRTEGEATMLLVRRPLDPSLEVAEHEVAVDGATITVRVTRPRAATAPLPAYVYAHGGGWCTGTLDTAEVECGPVADTVGCVVVSIGYRRAPEHPFPVPLEDCVAAYRWVHDHAAELGIDAARIGVGGTSAGANLVAALCLVARDRGLPMPCVQVLESPCLDLTLPHASIVEMGDGFGLTRDDIERFVDVYLAGQDPTQPYASPARADDHQGLAPIVVFTAELDPLRDDGEAYLAALRYAGVPGAGFRVAGHLHGSWIIPFTVSAGLIDDLRTAALRRAFAGTLDPMATPPAGPTPATGAAGNVGEDR